MVLSHNRLLQFHNRLKHLLLNPSQKETTLKYHFVPLSIYNIEIHRHQANLYPILPYQMCDLLQGIVRLYKYMHCKHDNFLFVKLCKLYDLILNHLRVQELYK